MRLVGLPLLAAVIFASVLSCSAPTAHSEGSAKSGAYAWRDCLTSPESDDFDPAVFGKLVDMAREWDGDPLELLYEMRRSSLRCDAYERHVIVMNIAMLVAAIYVPNDRKPTFLRYEGALEAERAAREVMPDFPLAMKGGWWFLLEEASALSGGQSGFAHVRLSPDVDELLQWAAGAQSARPGSHTIGPLEASDAMAHEVRERIAAKVPHASNAALAGWYIRAQGLRAADRCKVLHSLIGVVGPIDDRAWAELMDAIASVVVWSQTAKEYVEL